jgi:addiction module HigA family antidote
MRRPHASLARKYLSSRRLSVSEAARKMGITRVHLSRVLNGHRPITAEMAQSLARLTAIPPHAWLKRQAQDERCRGNPRLLPHDSQSGLRRHNAKRRASVRIVIGIFLRLRRENPDKTVKWYARGILAELRKSESDRRHRHQRAIASGRARMKAKGYTVEQIGKLLPQHPPGDEPAKVDERDVKEIQLIITREVTGERSSIGHKKLERLHQKAQRRR